MPTAWYAVPYIRDTNIGSPQPCRMCAINEQTATLRAVGGDWTETEIPFGWALVKVKAPLAALTQLDGLYQRLPKNRLDDPLSDLSQAAKGKLKNFALNTLGYTTAEISAHLPGDWGDYTLRDVLQFFASRRFKPRFDVALDQFFYDGPLQPVRPVENVDATIPDE